jgi:hypothetical protein
MIKQTKNHAPTPKPAQDLKFMQCKSKAMLEMMLENK